MRNWDLPDGLVRDYRSRRIHVDVDGVAATLDALRMLGSFKETKKGRGIEMEITEKKTYTITLGAKELETIKTALDVAKRQVQEEADGMDKGSESWRRCKERYTEYLELLHTMQ